MKEEKISIGRGRECDIVLADDSVSRYHAELFFLKEGRLLLIDCKSRNGTFLVKGETEKEIHQELISPYDTIRFGDVRIEVHQLLETIRQKYPTLPTVVSSKISSSPAVTPAPAKTRVTGKRLVRCQCGAVKVKNESCPECGK